MRSSPHPYLASQADFRLLSPEARIALRPFPGDGFWVKAVAFAVVGYLTLGRSFAYLGLAPLKIFVGEILLGSFLALRTREVLGRWLNSLVRATPLSLMGAALLLFLAHGSFELVRGFALGHPKLVAVQNFVFNYYPFYFFVGLWAGLRRTDLLERLIHTGAMIHGVYGMAAVIKLGEIPIYHPGSTVPLFGQPSGSALFILGLLCFRPKLNLYTATALALNAGILVGVQVRADWLAFLVTVSLWAMIARRLGTLVAGSLALSALLLLGLALDLRMPGMAARGGSVSAAGIVARVVAPFSEELAVEYGGRGARSTAGTVQWRMRWWGAIWSNVNSDSPATAAFGFGYGYPIGDLVPYLRHRDIRTPHNVFFYALAYGGWTGILVFFGFQFALGALQWRVFHLTGQPFGFLAWLLILLAALFGNVYETPFGAVPAYLIAGMAAAPIIQFHEGGNDDTSGS